MNIDLTDDEIRLVQSALLLAANACDSLPNGVANDYRNVSDEILAQQIERQLANG